MAPKKAAKKGPKHHDGVDLRRAYEHLHRVGLLHGIVEREAKQQVDALSLAAQSALVERDAECAADLLRAAEHICFGSMAPLTPDKNLNEQLASAAHEQYEHLTVRASEHWEQHDELAERGIAAIFHDVLSEAEKAYHMGALYRALEMARGAEALAHASPPKQRKLTHSAKPGKHLRDRVA